jgi:molybdopterin-guanine dinucleotide biosynthesis protein A
VLRSAAILAGGRASRFGGLDKSALVVDGETILDRQLAALAAVDGLDDRLIVGAAASRPGLRSIADVVPGSGPLGGIHAALTHAAHDAVCVVACDMPFITAPFIVRLFGELQNHDVVVPRTDRGYHPLCAIYTRACLEPIARRLADRKLKVRDLFADLRTRVVTLVNDDHRLVANVNTPQELATLHGHDKL